MHQKARTDSACWHGRCSTPRLGGRRSRSCTSHPVVNLNNVKRLTAVAETLKKQHLAQLERQDWLMFIELISYYLTFGHLGLLWYGAQAGCHVVHCVAFFLVLSSSSPSCVAVNFANAIWLIYPQKLALAGSMGLQQDLTAGLRINGFNLTSYLKSRRVGVSFIFMVLYTLCPGPYSCFFYLIFDMLYKL